MPNRHTDMDSTPGLNIVANNVEDVVYLNGHIDIDFSPSVRDQVLALLQSPYPKAVVIDLSAVTHIDSSGVATLIEVLKIARSHEIALRLQGLHDRLLRLFESTGILPLFNGNARKTSQPGYEAA